LNQGLDNWFIDLTSNNESECSMTESEFLTVAEAELDQIELRLERAAETADIDIECSRNGNLLEIEFVDTGSKIIVNTQAPMQEIWVAARSGGFHYRYKEGQWLDTRDGSELYSAMSSLVTLQAGGEVRL
jgi:CyaY protein